MARRASVSVTLPAGVSKEWDEVTRQPYGRRGDRPDSAHKVHADGFSADNVPRSSGGLATCGNAHGKLVDALADRVPRQGAGSVVVGLGMIDCVDVTALGLVVSLLVPLPTAVPWSAGDTTNPFRSEQLST
ncbi:hypothetical protein Axi01nite_21510 [Actinoplanes xinjiangensis]|nr:hypothetical protein Axi01nite_21510 [Actinoplanes xinjiangensis]